FDRADRLYGEATDLIDALLVNVTNRQIKSSLIASLSDAYLGHFKLAATKFSDPVKAYEIIEAARGRSVADSLQGESETLSSSDEITREAQKEINRIQLLLLRETDTEARQSLLEGLFAQELLLLPVRTGARAILSPDRRKPVFHRTFQSSLQ